MTDQAPPRRQRTGLRPVAPSPAFQTAMQGKPLTPEEAEKPALVAEPLPAMPEPKFALSESAVRSFSTVVKALSRVIPDPPRVDRDSPRLERPSGRYIIGDHMKVLTPHRAASATFPADFPRFALQTVQGFAFVERPGSDYPFWFDFQHEGSWFSCFVKAEWINFSGNGG